MKISSYNITDVGYHYIGLRVLAGLPSATRRDEQTKAISRNVQKYVTDKALRLLLPEPQGTFETVGEKICQELVHFKFAISVRGAYELTDEGRKILNLLSTRQHKELRRIMAQVHLETYDNLRELVGKYLIKGYAWMPTVEANHLSDKNYIYHLLEPTFGEETSLIIEPILEKIDGMSPKKTEDLLRTEILRQIIPDMNLALFRSLTDRLVSLRLLNVMKSNFQGCEFSKSYSPCVSTSPPHPWYVKLDLFLAPGKGSFSIYFCEPDMSHKDAQTKLLAALDVAFSELTPRAGYYELPEIRDFVCDHLKIPEASFDEGINGLLDLQTSPLTAGLQYEGISGRRKPLVRTREASQIHNLIRRN